MTDAAPRLPSPVQELRDDRLASAGVRLLLKRDDLIDPELPGNKWRKLSPNLDAARAEGHHVLLTFGGAYSNHLRAVAAAGARYGLATIGVVRGEELADRPRNWSLAYCEDRGMRLAFMDRATYRWKHTAGVLTALHAEYGRFYPVPEGGSNALAVAGAMEVPAEINVAYDVICCPVGTGGTLAGIAAGAPKARAIGFAALRGGGFLERDVRTLQEVARVRTSNWTVETRFHFDGFAKHPPELRMFAEEFATRHGIRLELTYVAKMLAGLYSMIEAGEFAPGTTIAAVVTGPAEGPR